MLCAHWYCATSAILLMSVHYVFGDFEYVVSKPEAITVPLDFETLLLCEMNIEPDKFQWKFYPSDKPYDSKAYINLSNATYRLIPENDYRVIRKKSELSVQVKTAEAVGDYQCLAYYGASVVASVPWRITIARLKKFTAQKTVAISVQSGNTVSWRCDAPESNPVAYIDYNKGDKYIAPPFKNPFVKSMILANVTVQHSGTYSCTATNTFQSETSNAVLKLEVVRNGPSQAPTFIMEPKKEYTVTKGSSVFLECSAIGKPVPTVTWFKKQSQLPSDRTEMVPGGLIIKNATSNDDGFYVCTHTNSYGSISHQITVKYNEEPSIECFTNITDIKQGENMDIDCEVKGTPEPQIAWFLNGFSVFNDSAVEAIGNKIYFRPIEKRHAGNLQIFARNVVKTVYSSISIRVIPLTSSIDEIQAPVHPHPRHSHRKSQNTRRPSKHKTPKMIPPSKPMIARLNDETVVVRWNVPNNNGLPIQFFKVQYKEVGSANHKDNYSGKVSGWNTANTDIPPNIKAYDISGLKSDHIYKFRVAAVYTNNDSKMSSTSKKFHLRRLDFDDRNPLPVCLITNVETVNHTAVKMYWQCPEYNVTVDGFYISYMSATRAGDDYMKSTVEGENTRSYVINYLTPETSYDIKLQSFNSKLASDFSPLMKARTGVNPVTLPITTQPTTSKTNSSAEQNSIDSNIYIIIAGGVIGFALVIIAIVLLFVCRKWQKKKLTDNNRDKPNVVDHNHIQVDSNDYVVEPKPITRSNGCAVPGNRITITTNPLAAEPDKNPNVIEMRHLANNNVRHQSGDTAGAGVPLEQHEEGEEQGVVTSSKPMTSSKLPLAETGSAGGANKDVKEKNKSRKNVAASNGGGGGGAAGQREEGTVGSNYV